MKTDEIKELLKQFKDPSLVVSILRCSSLTILNKQIQVYFLF